MLVLFKDSTIREDQIGSDLENSFLVVFVEHSSLSARVWNVRLPSCLKKIMTPFLYMSVERKNS